MNDTENPVADTSISTPDTGDSNQTTEVQAEKQTPEPASDSTQEESFFDPNQVPEELKPAYKQMQADYTRKTQDLAKQRKEIEAIRAKAEQFSKYEPYAPVLEEMLNAKPKEQANPEMAALEQQLKTQGYSDEAIEMMKMGVGFALNQFNQKEQAKELQQKELEFKRNTETKISDAEKLDTRLTDENLKYTLSDGKSLTFGEIVGNLVRSNPDWVNDPVSATRSAIATIDALIGQSKSEGKQELSQSARSKASKFPSVNSSPQSASKTGGKYSSMKEAGLETLKELGSS